MYLYQIGVVIFLIAMTLITRRNTEVLGVVAIHVIGILMFLTISAEHYNYYYTLMCGVLLVSGFILHQQFRVAAICSYILVPVNALGCLLWYKYYPHDLYNIVASIILVIQFLSTLPKVLLNGIDTTIDRYSVASGCRFDGNKECATMHKKPQTQEDKK